MTDNTPDNETTGCACVQADQLCGCMKQDENGIGGCGISCTALCCPCILYGQICAGIPSDTEKCSCYDTGCCFAYVLASYVPCATLIMTFKQRQDFHTKQLGTYESCGQSCCLAMFCTFCGFVQMQKQLKSGASASDPAEEVMLNPNTANTMDSQVDT